MQRLELHWRRLAVALAPTRGCTSAGSAVQVGGGFEAQAPERLRTSTTGAPHVPDLGTETFGGRSMSVMDRFGPGGKVAIVTGASSGLGVAFARALAVAGRAAGCQVRRSSFALPELVPSRSQLTSARQIRKINRFAA